MSRWLVGLFMRPQLAVSNGREWEIALVIPPLKSEIRISGLSLPSFVPPYSGEAKKGPRVHTTCSYCLSDVLKNQRICTQEKVNSAEKYK